MKTVINKIFLIMLIVILFSSCSDTENLPSITPQSSEMPSLSENINIIKEEEITEETDSYGNTIILNTNDTTNFPLYAMIKEDDIYLYGVKPYGMVLYQNGKGTYFEWEGLTPRLVLPQIMYYDFDNDGNKELAVILYVSSGTGVSMTDLHILTIEENGWYKPQYTDYCLSADDVNEWLTEKIIFSLADDNKSFTMDFCGKNYTVSCDINEETGAFVDVKYTSCIVRFEFIDNRIQVTVPVGVLYEKYATLWDYFGDIKADVIFDGKNFKIENYTFILYS